MLHRPGASWLELDELDATQPELDDGVASGLDGSRCGRLASAFSDASGNFRFGVGKSGSKDVIVVSELLGGWSSGGSASPLPSHTSRLCDLSSLGVFSEAVTGSVPQRRIPFSSHPFRRAQHRWQYPMVGGLRVWHSRHDQ